MRTPLCEEFGIEYPIFAFTPSEHVAAAVSRAGGLGVLGCVRFNDAEELERVLTWLDDNTDGKPYGVDIVMPMKIPTEGTSLDLGAMIPEEHKKFVDETLLKLGVPPLPEGEGREGVLGWLHSVARSHLDVALQAPAGADRQRARLAAGRRDREVPRARHQGRRARRRRQARALARAQRRRHHRGPGLRGRRPHRRGRQHGAAARHRRRRRPRRTRCSAPAASAPAARSPRRSRSARRVPGWARSGSAPTEYQLMGAANSEAWETAFTRATSSDTVRTRVYTGKPARLLKTKWTEAWDEEGAPTPLPMPLQNLLVAEAHNRISAANDPDVISMPIGQIVGRMNEVRPVADVMADLVAEFEATVDRLDDPLGRGVPAGHVQLPRRRRLVTDRR